MRYHENQVNTPIDAPLTSESHNFWLDRWIFKFHTFLETRSQDISRGFKIKPIQRALQVATLQGAPPCKACWGYKRPQAPSDQKKRRLSWVLLSTWTFSTHFPSLSNAFLHRKTLIKQIKASWFFSSPKIQGIVLISNLSFLGSIPWIWGLGVWM